MKWQWIFWFVLGLTFAVWITRPAPAQPVTKVPMVCGPQKDVVKRFFFKYRERPVAAGRIQGQTNHILIMANQRGDWTLLIWKPGHLCPIIVGDGWKLKTGAEL